MPAYLISGPSGSGKSTVGRVLAERGYNVIETDFEPGMSSWVNIETGEKIASQPTQPVSKSWLDAHAWDWDREIIERLIKENTDSVIFFCGGAHNEKHFFELFKKRFALIANSRTIVERLKPREPARWVEGTAEIKNVIEWNEKFRDYSISQGAILIDSEKDPKFVADLILEQLDEA